MTRVTFSEMEQFALNEANRIGTVQNALVEAGLLKRADPTQLRNKEVCEALLRLIDTCRSDPIIMDRLKEAAKAGT